MDYSIAVIPGDGIGPEIIIQTMDVLHKIADRFGHHFACHMLLAGGTAIDGYGTALPAETVETCKKSEAVMLGAVGGPKWDNMDSYLRPEKALLGLRKELGLYANIRPAVLHAALKEACPLRPEIAEKGIDICIVRELTGGIYFGERGIHQGEKGLEAYDTERYSAAEVERIARLAFKIAGRRRKKVTSVDKANILESSRLWRSVVNEVAREFPDIELHHLYVDNAAMQLIREPRQFDVLLTTNMFGDILSDEASMITGSIGMLPSASLGDSKRGLYEPIHGSAPDIAGQDIANPVAAILSAAMMLRYSLDLSEEADAIEQAVASVLGMNYRTPDIFSPGKELVGTKKMTELIVKALDQTGSLKKESSGQSRPHEEVGGRNNE